MDFGFLEKLWFSVLFPFFSRQIAPPIYTFLLPSPFPPCGTSPPPSRVVGYQTNNCSVPLGLCLFARVQWRISPIQNSAHDDTIGVSDSIGSRNNTGPGRPLSIAATVVMLPSGGDLQLGGGGHFTRPVGPEDTAD